MKNKISTEFYPCKDSFNKKNDSNHTKVTVFSIMIWNLQEDVGKRDFRIEVIYYIGKINGEYTLNLDTLIVQPFNIVMIHSNNL